MREKAGRTLLVAGAWWFVPLRETPVVRLEAQPGLSPPPREKLAGIKGAFSVMTEGMVRLAHGDLEGSITANRFPPLMAAVVNWVNRARFVHPGSSER